LTGLHPRQNGVTRNGLILEDSFETVAERLHGAGYMTVAIVASFPLHPQFGATQGFAEYQTHFVHSLRDRSAWLGFEVQERGFYAWAE